VAQLPSPLDQPAARRGFGGWIEHSSRVSPCMLLAGAATDRPKRGLLPSEDPRLRLGVFVVVGSAVRLQESIVACRAPCRAEWVRA